MHSSPIPFSSKRSWRCRATIELPLARMGVESQRYCTSPSTPQSSKDVPLVNYLDTSLFPGLVAIPLYWQGIGDTHKNCVH